MNGLEAAAVFAAGVAAGGINAVVGSGTLITFPTLVALGFPPVTANITNNIGLVSGTVASAYGYRQELKGQRDRLLRLGAGSLVGTLIGAALLLGLPADAFKVIVPVLIVVALVLVVVQPRVNAWLAARREHHHAHGGPWLWFGVLGAGIYGGYFGAAQGIILIALLGIFLDDDLQRLNGAKNVLAFVVNGAAALVFVGVWLAGHADIDWLGVLLIALGSTVGGLLGASAGRRLPPAVLRGVIVAVGVTAIVNLVRG
ncbi:MAG TPA: sulfite exporter TauE/SafE family protein [Thermomonospora sp.]|nr:sulfite exporter TauE/SafE family protein [Thermomonospora sp.]